MGLNHVKTLRSRDSTFRNEERKSGQQYGRLGSSRLLSPHGHIK